MRGDAHVRCGGRSGETGWPQGQHRAPGRPLQNTVLRRQVVRVRYEPADRAWFATLSAIVPRSRWVEVFPVSPATLLSWHRRLVAGKYTPARRAPGRPSTRAAVKA